VKKVRGTFVDRHRQAGFTLLELVVTIIVIAILAAAAAPSFTLMRERQALRGVADNFVIAVGLAKQEAIKRDALVRVDFMPSGDAVCVGAVVVAAAGDAGCDCSEDACDVSAFPDEPGNTVQLRRVTLSGDVDFGDAGSGFVIDPRTGTLFDISDNGGFELATGTGYRVQLEVNAMGRASYCTPADATKALPGVPACD
jgi:type IV fimbrial biogenesis protein FimT